MCMARALASRNRFQEWIHGVANCADCKVVLEGRKTKEFGVT